MPRIAVSGISSHIQRYMRGRDSRGLEPRYSEVPHTIYTKLEIISEIKRIQNTGNYLIGDGVRRALNRSELTNIPLAWLVQGDTAPVIDHVNNNFDFFVLGTANIFHPRFLPTDLAALITKLRVPVVLMSAGIQRREDVADGAPPIFAPLIEALRNHEHFVFTRGHETAAFLRREGLTAVEPVGCPSLYAFPAQMKRAITRLKTDFNVREANNVALAGYLGSGRDMVMNANVFGRKLGKAAYVHQDEFVLFNIQIEEPDAKPIYVEASGRIEGKIVYDGVDELKTDLSHHVFFNTDQWRSWMSQHDFAFGKRFHGNVMASQAGVPNVTLAQDDRMREMLGYIRLPHMEAAEWNHSPDKTRLMEVFISQLNVGELGEHYQSCHEKFRGLVKKLGLSA